MGVGGAGLKLGVQTNPHLITGPKRFKNDPAPPRLSTGPAPLPRASSAFRSDAMCTACSVRAAAKSASALTAGGQTGSEA